MSHSGMKGLRRRLKGTARKHFLTGLLVMVPLGLTCYVVSSVVGAMDRVLAILPPRFHPETYLPFRVPGQGLLVTLALIQAAGFLSANLFGRSVVRAYERVLERIPLVRGIYAAVKQVMEQLLSEKSDRFRRVVLFEFPRQGVYSLGFVTGPASGELGARAGSRSCNVFIPCTPNPTSGFYLVIPEAELTTVDLTVEQAFKIILSGGMVGADPPQQKARSPVAGERALEPEVGVA